MKHPVLNIKDPYGFTVEERLIAIERAIRDGASSSVPFLVHCILDALDLQGRKRSSELRSKAAGSGGTAGSGKA